MTSWAVLSRQVASLHPYVVSVALTFAKNAAGAILQLTTAQEFQRITAIMDCCARVNYALSRRHDNTQFAYQLTLSRQATSIWGEAYIWVWTK